MTFGPGPLLIISGPTASGKSSLAVLLAQHLDGEVISTDSAQVYRGFDIGTDKIADADRSGIPHHGIDIVEPTEACNVFTWLRHAAAAHREVLQRGRTSVFAGGTTMYISAMVSGLDNLPPADPELRAELEHLSSMELYARACALHAAEDINANDRLRLIRAIEVQASREIGRSGSAWPARQDALMLVLTDERSRLYDRINARVEEMFRAGLLEEARRLINEYGAHSPAFRTVGYSQCAAFFKEPSNPGVLSNSIATASRRYAKRQMTFWRNEPHKRNWRTIPANTERDGAFISVTFNQLLERVKKRLLRTFDRPEVWYIDRETLARSAD